jgi:predicted transcriptional regulator of viral defense system
MVTAVRDTAPPETTIRDVLQRVQGEYRDMPGLKLTEAQAQRLLGIDCDACAVILSTLIERGFLRRTDNGLYVRAWD